jgi:hypothetical protein
MDTMALPQITLAIWEKGGSSALNRHTVVVRRFRGCLLPLTALPLSDFVFLALIDLYAYLSSHL